MKKVFIRLFIISVISMILSGAFCVASIMTYDAQSRTEKLLNEIQENDNISDVEGYAYIVEGAGSVLADLGEAIAQMIFIILIPGSILFLLMIVQIISMIMQIGKQSQRKALTAIICTYISFCLHVMLCLNLCFIIWSNLLVNKRMLFVALVLNVISCIVFIIQIGKIHYKNIIQIQKA